MIWVNSIIHTIWADIQSHLKASGKWNQNRIRIRIRTQLSWGAAKTIMLRLKSSNWSYKLPLQLWQKKCWMNWENTYSRGCKVKYLLKVKQVLTWLTWTHKWLIEPQVTSFDWYVLGAFGFNFYFGVCMVQREMTKDWKQESFGIWLYVFYSGV